MPTFVSLGPKVPEYVREFPKRTPSPIVDWVDGMPVTVGYYWEEPLDGDDCTRVRVAPETETCGGGGR